MVYSSSRRTTLWGTLLAMLRLSSSKTTHLPTGSTEIALVNSSSNNNRFNSLHNCFCNHNSNNLFLEWASPGWPDWALQTTFRTIEFRPRSVDGSLGPPSEGSTVWRPGTIPTPMIGWRSFWKAENERWSMGWRRRPSHQKQCWTRWTLEATKCLLEVMWVDGEFVDKIIYWCVLIYLLFIEAWNDRNKGGYW